MTVFTFGLNEEYIAEDPSEPYYKERYRFLIIYLFSDKEESFLYRQSITLFETEKTSGFDTEINLDIRKAIHFSRTSMNHINPMQISRFKKYNFYLCWRIL